MSLLLHLSDLHLGNKGDEDDVGDYTKSESISSHDRVQRAGLLRSTLRALHDWLVYKGETLAAIVVTGDVTTRARPDGFDQLADILGSLQDSSPDATRIVVVPGNHDVVWETEPGSAERYEAFIAGVRRHGYVTPLLDGVDYNGDDPKPGASPLLIGDDFVIAAVNSANWCGVVEPLPADIETAVTDLVSRSLLDDNIAHEIRRLQLFDMPRISNRQLDALADALNASSADGAARVRIAALHHQLVPVREEEEVKPFESLVNQAAFVGFLGDAGFDVVLHGHKHADRVQTLWLPEGRGARGAVVASCGTIGPHVGAGNEVAKLIRIDSSLPTLRTVEILAVPALGHGQRSLRDRITSVHRAPARRARGATPITVIVGATAADVHEQLMEQAAAARPGRDVICVVDDGATASKPPPSYPWPADPADDVYDWFADTIRWWQDPVREEGKPFTHGQRLKAWAGAGSTVVDQVQVIANALRADPGTSRGVAILVDPSTDPPDTDIAFPSFSLLHVWIEADRLHCSAFFRKQEMRYWWAVNAAEIAQVQREIIDSLRGEHSDLKPGAIRTHASEAVYSERLPKVNVPRIDRQYWHDADSVRVLAVAIADVDAPGRRDDLDALLALLDEAAPRDTAPPADGAPAAGPGLLALTGALTALTDRYPDSPARDAAELLRDVSEANLAYVASRDSNPAAYRAWRDRVNNKLARLHQILDARAPRD